MASKKVIDELTIERIPNGIKIFCRSEAIEDFMKSISIKNADGTPKTAFIPNFAQSPATKFYQLDIAADVDKAIFVSPADRGLLLKIGTVYAPNLNIFRAEGLAQGITFIYEGLYPQSQIKLWQELTIETIKKLAKKYFTNFRISLSLSYHELEG